MPGKSKDKNKPQQSLSTSPSLSSFARLLTTSRQGGGGEVAAAAPAASLKEAPEKAPPPARAAVEQEGRPPSRLASTKVESPQSASRSLPPSSHHYRHSSSPIHNGAGAGSSSSNSSPQSCSPNQGSLTSDCRVRILPKQPLTPIMLSLAAAEQPLPQPFSALPSPAARLHFDPKNSSASSSLSPALRLALGSSSNPGDLNRADSEGKIGQVVFDEKKKRNDDNSMSLYLRVFKDSSSGSSCPHVSPQNSPRPK